MFSAACSLNQNPLNDRLLLLVLYPGIFTLLFLRAVSVFYCGAHLQQNCSSSLKGRAQSPGDTAERAKARSHRDVIEVPVAGAQMKTISLAVSASDCASV